MRGRRGQDVAAVLIRQGMAGAHFGRGPRPRWCGWRTLPLHHQRLPDGGTAFARTYLSVACPCVIKRALR